MEPNLVRQLRWLKVYTALLTLAVVIFIVKITRDKSHVKIKEISTERLNIVDSTGTLRMVLANKDRIPNPVIDGKEYPRSIRPAGIVFFDENGTEAGGLATTTHPKRGKTTVFAMDYARSEAIGMVNYHNGKAGDGAFIVVNDPSPEGPIEKVGTEGINRISIGTSKKDASLEICDTNGKTRIRMAVNAKNEPVFEILDEKGEVTTRIPNK